MYIQFAQEFAERSQRSLFLSYELPRTVGSLESRPITTIWVTLGHGVSCNLCARFFREQCENCPVYVLALISARLRFQPATKLLRLLRVISVSQYR